MSDTIAATATAPGEAGIGVIRISGPEAAEIMNKVFVPASGKPVENRHMTYGSIRDGNSGQELDEALCVLMRGPESYTGEDIVEVHCHGGMMPLRQTLELILSRGCRLAEPGEFTKRAFLNGKMDLMQAEAVADLISAKAHTSYRAAEDQLAGKLSKPVRALRDDLTDILVDLTVNIDYPDEDIEELTYNKLADGLEAAIGKTKKLLDGADTGRIIREGLRVAIVGKPNVGKSSMLNRLLRENRAIVTDIPGTTRDTIEEHADIRGIPMNFIDTAGIRKTNDSIEKIGIDRSNAAIERADAVILIIDGSTPLTDDDRKLMRNYKPGKTILVINKTDLPMLTDKNELAALLPDAEIIKTSMKEEDGLVPVEDALEKLVYMGKNIEPGSMIVTNARHKSLLEACLSSLNSALRATGDRIPHELVEIDVNAAYMSLGKILGDEAENDIINQVFARFCLGK